MEKDDIISRQWELIRTMTENNLRNVGSDLWGMPSAPTPKPPQPWPETPTEPPAQTAGPAAEKSGHSEGAAPAQPEQQPTPEEAPPESIDDLREELNSYIGLEQVKAEVNDLINLVTVYQMRRQHDLPTVDMSLHLVFTGNPGTGKTMMARMMARIYKSLGMLSKGHLVEVDRSGLVAGYVGQTAIKTGEVIQKALGGVLFIDEAYALNSRSENDFGQEAIDTLLKAMEDHREDLVVIVAGYVDEMEEFIHSNPGLESRFNRYLFFEDYSVEEMLAIFEMRCKKSCYTLEDGARDALKAYFLTRSLEDPIAFGNARGVRNTFEKVLVQQANRLSAMEKVEKEDLMLLKEEDVLALLPAGAQPTADEAPATETKAAEDTAVGEGENTSPADAQ